MFEETKEESHVNNSSSDDNPDCDSYQDFKSQQRQECSTTSSMKLGSDERKIITYSHNEALIVAENLRYDSTVNEALSTLKMWLEKGECTKQTAGTFHLLIQGVCAHVDFLQKKKEDCKESLSKCESEFMQYIQNSRVMFDTIRAIFNLAQQEKVQNLFTKSHRCDIKKSTEVIENFQKELIDDMTFCDGSVSKDNIIDGSYVKDEGIDRSTEEEKLQIELKKLQEEKMRFCSQLAAIQEEKKRLHSQLATCNDEHKQHTRTTDFSTNVNFSNFGIQKQAQIIAVISPFLYAHRDVGQTLAVILSHLKYMGFCVSEQEVEDILNSNPSLFQTCIYKKGNSVEKRWIFCGYQC